jgi:S1-C subfamily serine protease
MREKLTWAVVIFASMVLGGGVVIGMDSLRDDSSTSAQASPQVIERTVNAAGGVSMSQRQDVSELYARVKPSVVEINAANSRSTAGSLGSGIVLDKEGYILTNNHVIRGFDQIDVAMSDGTAVSAKIVGVDAGNDLALLKIDVPADKLSPATLGDSSAVKSGQLVIAVGNPFGIEGSVTQGIVSGVGRTLGGGAGRPLRALIQSDAAINPGNSGGALFDINGNVIGITTAIENPSGDRVFVGIGYAVPINTAKRFIPDMKAGKKIEHPRMGVSLTAVTPALAKSNNLGVDQGLLVTTIDPDSAAAKAGIRGGAPGARTGIGDVITAVDNKQVKTFEDLADYIDDKKVGDTIKVKYMRDGKESTVDIVLDAWRQSDNPQG